MSVKKLYYLAHYLGQLNLVIWGDKWGTVSAEWWWC